MKAAIHGFVSCWAQTDDRRPGPGASLVEKQVARGDTVWRLMAQLGWSDREIAHWLPEVQRLNAERFTDFKHLVIGSRIELPVKTAGLDVPDLRVADAGISARDARVDALRHDENTATGPAKPYLRGPSSQASHRGHPVGPSSALAEPGSTLTPQSGLTRKVGSTNPDAAKRRPEPVTTDTADSRLEIEAFRLFDPSESSPTLWVEGLRQQIFDPIVEDLAIDTSGLPNSVAEDVVAGVEEVRKRLGTPKVIELPRGRSLFEDASTLLHRAADLANPDGPDSAALAARIEEVTRAHPDATIRILGLHASKRVKPTPWHIVLEVHRSSVHEPEVYATDGERKDWKLVDDGSGGRHWRGAANASTFRTVTANFEETFALVLRPDGQWQLNGRDDPLQTPPGVSHVHWRRLFEQHSRNFATAEFARYHRDAIAHLAQAIAQKERLRTDTLAQAEAGMRANPSLYAETYQSVEELRDHHSAIESFIYLRTADYERFLNAQLPAEAASTQLEMLRGALEEHKAVLRERGYRLSEFLPLPMLKQRHGVSIASRSVSQGSLQQAFADQVEYPVFYREDAATGEILIIDLMDLAEYRGSNWDEALASLAEHNIYRRGYIAVLPPDRSEPWFARSYDWGDEVWDGIDGFVSHPVTHAAANAALVGTLAGGVAAPFAAGTMIVYGAAATGYETKRWVDDGATDRHRTRHSTAGLLTSAFYLTPVAKPLAPLLRHAAAGAKAAPQAVRSVAGALGRAGRLR